MEPCCYDHEEDDLAAELPRLACTNCDDRGEVPAVCTHGKMRHLCGYCGPCSRCGGFRVKRVWCDWCKAIMCGRCAVSGPWVGSWQAGHRLRYCSAECRDAKPTIEAIRKSATEAK